MYLVINRNNGFLLVNNLLTFYCVSKLYVFTCVCSLVSDSLYLIILCTAHHRLVPAPVEQRALSCPRVEPGWVLRQQTQRIDRGKVLRCL